MAGRKPLPIEMHRLTGTYRKSRHGAAKGVFADGTVPDLSAMVCQKARGRLGRMLYRFWRRGAF